MATQGGAHNGTAAYVGNHGAAQTTGLPQMPQQVIQQS